MRILVASIEVGFEETATTGARPLYFVRVMGEHAGSVVGSHGVVVVVSGPVGCGKAFKRV